MRIPEFLFPLINLVVRALLSSPLHSLMSDSVLVIHYTGRKSGRALATPVRYQPLGAGARVTTSDHTQWWRNLEAQPDVELLIRGKKAPFRARLLPRDPAQSEPLLREFLAQYPQDAAYQDIRLNKDGSLNEEDVSAALDHLIIVEFDPV